MKIDWSKAPEGAEFYACGHIYKALGSSLYSASYEKYLRAIDKLALGEALKANDKWSWCLSFHDLASIKGFSDYEPRPKQWPSESRIDIIGTNGNTAEHYMDETLHQTARVHYETLAEKAAREKAQKKRHRKIIKETFGEKAKEITDTIDNLILSDLIKLQDAACVSGTGAEKAVKSQNKYDREIIGKYGSGKCIVDVYRVLVAFGDIPPEIQHALKKLLAGGKRGHKDEGMDYLEAIQSIEAYLNRLDDSSDQHK